MLESRSLGCVLHVIFVLGKALSGGLAGMGAQAINARA